jgi:hypothetical protein
MADVTLSSGSVARPYRSPWGAFPTRNFESISSNAIHVGQVLTLDWTGSTNTKRVCASTAVPYFFGVGLAGSSRGASTSVVGNVTVYEANPHVEFRAFTKGGALASSLVGLRRTINRDSTLNIDYIDVTASTATDWRVLVTEILGTEGDTGGEVAFKFLPKLTENIGSSVSITSTSPVLAFFG